nr:MAG TPA: COMM domain-containing protein [Caudoviricetes sp.]
MENALQNKLFDEMTVEEFIALTRNAFGGEIIKRLEEG